MTVAASAEELRRDRGLRRAIGPVGLAAAIVNVVVGAGVFVLPAAMARAAGSSALWAYAACAVVMGAVVLCCAEAGSRLPTSGGLYGYVDAAFGPLAGFTAGVLLWLSCVLACGGIASALADAVGRLVPALASPGARAVVILLAVGGPAALNGLGVATASRVISAATAVKLIPLGLFVCVGALYAHAPSATAAVAAPRDLGGFGRAVILSLFAFQGMETALGASGEVDRPTRTLPLALIAAMAFVTALYVAVQLVAQGLLGPALAASPSPLADGMATVDLRLGRLVAAGAAVSMAAWIGSDLLGAPRVLFAFARDGHLPAWLGRVTKRGRVPAPAIAAHAVVSAVLALTGAFEQLAVLSVLAACGLYIAACLAAWRLARRGVAELGPPLRLPGLGPAVVLGVAGMAAAVALARPVEIAGFLLTVAGAAGLHVLLRRRGAARVSGPTP